MNDLVLKFFQHSYFASTIMPMAGYLLAYLVTYDEVRKRRRHRFTAFAISMFIGFTGYFTVLILELAIAEIIIALVHQ